VEVLALPATPTITASAEPQCQGTDVVFGVVNPVAGATYTWSSNAAGTVSGAGNSTCTVSGATAGEKTVTVNMRAVTSGLLCQSAESPQAQKFMYFTPPTPVISQDSNLDLLPCGETYFHVDLNDQSEAFEWSCNQAGTQYAEKNHKLYTPVTAKGPLNASVYAYMRHETPAGVLTCNSLSASVNLTVQSIASGNRGCPSGCAEDVHDGVCVYRWLWGDLAIAVSTPLSATECQNTCTRMGWSILSHNWGDAKALCEWMAVNPSYKFEYAWSSYCSRCPVNCDESGFYKSGTWPDEPHDNVSCVCQK
jgi:hypothetical protein